MRTTNLGKFTYMFFFYWDICFTYQFLEDQKLKQERSCEVLKKIICFVRSYPRCPILPRFTVLFLLSRFCIISRLHRYDIDALRIPCSMACNSLPPSFPPHHRASPHSIFVGIVIILLA